MTSQQFTYSLDKSSKKAVCPQCQQRRLVLYRVSGTGDLLANIVGRCDREDNCGYHLTPKEYFKANTDRFPAARTTQVTANEISKPIAFLPFDLMDRSVSKHKHCDLYPFLEALFRKEIAERLCQDYFIGSN